MRKKWETQRTGDDADLCRHACIQSRLTRTSSTPTQTQRNYPRGLKRMCRVKWESLDVDVAGLMDCLHYGAACFCRKKKMLGGVVEVVEVLNLHNPFLQPAFKSTVVLYFLVSLHICSCQTTHVREIGALHCKIPPDVSKKKPKTKTRLEKEAFESEYCTMPCNHL